MSHYPNQPDPRIPESEGMDEIDAEGYVRFELACAASLAAQMGGHPENAPALERTLLIAAGLERA